MTCNICINKEKMINKWIDIEYEGTCDVCGNKIDFDKISVKYSKDITLRNKKFHDFDTKIMVICLSCSANSYGLKIYCEDWEADCNALFIREYAEVENGN